MRAAPQAGDDEAVAKDQPGNPPAATPAPLAVERDEAEVRRYAERYAAVLAEAGIPRMPARVFATLAVTDSGRLTAAELARLLHASPAAISGAVRYLAQVHLVSRQHEPGSRRDHYQLHDDVWQDAILNREPLMARWVESAREGAELLGPDTPAGARLTEAQAFFEFTAKEMPAMLDRWRTIRATLRDT
jgi:DNA-binding transcriptional regulator GbsR (MarR family)